MAFKYLFRVVGSVCVSRSQMWASVVTAASCLFHVSMGLAELPQLERIAASFQDELKPQLKDASVVVAVRALGKDTGPWAVHEALANEITAALRIDEVQAISAASDLRLESLSESKADFVAADVKRVKLAGFTRFLGGTLQSSSPAKLKLSLWDTQSETTSWSKTIEIPANALQLDANVPELNRKMVAFCRQNLNTAVGDGICATLAGEGLAAIGATRSGIYTWGRELSDQEPMLPGDVLQMELIEMKGPKFSRSFRHHTAVIEECRPDAIVVLQQNVAPKGKVVQRDTWPLASFKRGYLVAFRPWNGSSPLPPISPRRRSPPTIAKMGKAIDLFRTINPRLDSVKGVWFLEDGTLRPNRDTWARLQVPVDPPDHYTLRLKVKRLVGKDQLGVGLIVGGQQTMVSFDAYGGTVSGLHLVDGKASKNNSTAWKGTVLPEDKVVSLKIKVAPESVTAEADGKSIVNWKGNANQLSIDEKYAMPRQDWLFLASWNSHFSISEFLLDDTTPGQK